MHYLSVLITISTRQVYLCTHDAVVSVSINWGKMHMIMCSRFVFIHQKDRRCKPIPHLYDLECVSFEWKIFL